MTARAAAGWTLLAVSLVCAEVGAHAAWGWHGVLVVETAALTLAVAAFLLHTRRP